MTDVGSSGAGTRRAEVVVVGAGIIGLAAADALARGGVDVACLERGAPGSGQSAGLTRIFRHVHGLPALVALSRRSRAAWGEWEERTGRRLVGDEGVLVAGDDPEAGRARLAAEDLEARVVGPDDQRAVLPTLGAGAGVALLDPGGGAIRARRAVGAMADALGGRLVAAEVVGLHPDGEGVLVQSTEGLWRAERALVCAGARTAELARSLGVDLPVAAAAHVRVTFAVRPEHRGASLACWIDHDGETGEPVYGGPVGGSGAYALGLSARDADPPVSGGGVTLPAGADLRPAVARLSRYVARAFPGLDPAPVGLRVCVTTSLPWERDAFACWPAGPVTLFAGSNLFKHAPALGPLLAEAVTSGRIPPVLAPPP